MDITLAIHIAKSTPGGPALHLIGPPGCGKTRKTEQYAAFFKKHFEGLFPNALDPTDLLGLPYRTDAGVRYDAPAWARRIAGTDGILLIDEANTAPPSVQAPMMRVTLDRVVGEIELGPDVQIVLATNPEHEASGAFQTSAAFNNRLWHVVADAPGIQAYQAYMMRDARPAPIELEPVDPENWQRAWEAERIMVCAFLQTFPAYLSEDSRKAVGAEYASFATPRSWEQATRLAATARCLGVERGPIYVGTIGERIAPELVAYASTYGIPDPVEFLRGHVEWTPDPARTDILFAFTSAVVATLRRNPFAADERESVWKRAWHAMALAAPGADDIAYNAAFDLLQPPTYCPTLPPEAVKLISTRWATLARLAKGLR